MAKVVVPGRGIVAGGITGGSRVVTVWTQVKPADIWPSNFGVSQPLGQKLVIEELQVWFDPRWTIAGSQLVYGFHVGTGWPVDVPTVQAWTMIMPVWRERNITRHYTQTQQSEPQCWTMQRLFEGQALRLGIWLTVSGVVTIAQMYTSFRIREV